MIRRGILNPEVLSLLARVRHTNTLVIADRGFPFWPHIHTVDISLIDDIPTVLQVLQAIRENFVIGQVWMAQEFLQHNQAQVHERFRQAFAPLEPQYEPHLRFKERIPAAVGLIRTGDTTQYANLILESA